MRLSDLTSETKKLAVVYKTAANEFTIVVEYRTQAVSLGFLSEVNAKEGLDKTVYQLENVLVSWDLTDDNDKVIPVTAEAIKENNMPVYLLYSILDAIVQDRFAISDDSKNE